MPCGTSVKLEFKRCKEESTWPVSTPSRSCNPHGYFWSKGKTWVPTHLQIVQFGRHSCDQLFTILKYDFPPTCNANQANIVVMKINWFWMWIGGAISRVAGTALVVGSIIVVFGTTPGQAVAELLVNLPPWLTNPWFKLTLFILGLVIIGVSLHFNVWSLRQRAIDDLAEDLSWAIHDLLNRRATNAVQLTQWESDYKGWCERVSKKLENRAFFTRADQLHFERLGSIPAVDFQGSFNPRHNSLKGHLNLKFDRLRDLINWTQMRKR